MTPFKAKNTFGIPFLRTGPRQLVSVLNQILSALDAVRVVQGGEVTSTGTIIRPGSATAGSPPRSAPSVLYTQALTVAGVIPSNTEIATALVAAYTTAATTPRAGDVINLTVSGVCKFRSTVSATGTASGLFVVAFTVGSTNYFGNQVQTGLY